MSDGRQSRDPNWDEALELLGREAVIARLGIGEVSGTGPGVEFKLWVSQLKNPSRGYVEQWLARNAAEARFRTNVTLTVAAAAAGIVAGILIAAWPAPWPAVLDWFK